MVIQILLQTIPYPIHITILLYDKTFGNKLPLIKGIDNQYLFKKSF